VREARFRSVYNAVVIGVARNGERVRGNICDIRLRPGDTLLLEAEAGFDLRHRDSRDFLLVRSLEDSTPRRHARAPIALAILVAMVAAASIGVVSMLVAAMVAAGLMVLSRCCTISEGRRQVDWSLLVVIGAALGIGRALETSGAAGAIASWTMSLAGGHPWLVLIAVYAVTMVLTEVITNNAAVALMFPFAIATSETLGVNPMPFIMCVTMAGSPSGAG
jgi:di/tricarboxylate transporter